MPVQPWSLACDPWRDNRATRRAYGGERTESMDPEIFPLLFGLFAGPEAVPQELVDQFVLDRIRSA
ncbi:MAG: hypothetical protein NVS3B12_34860 [Acidimicrobiales bacterium]